MPNISPAKPARSSDALSFLAFNALLLPFVPLLGLYALWRRYGQGRSAASLRGQWGHVPVEARQALQDGAPRVWLHAVSVGETVAARPVARALRELLPACRIGLSVTTDTGFDTAQAALKSGEVDAVVYYPLDVPWAVQRALRAVRPHVFLTLETELWPNFLHLARRRGAAVFLVNGRVSDNLLRQAPRLGWIWRWMMRNLDAALMRSGFDAERMKMLAPPSTDVMVTGDVKLDNQPANQRQSAAHWRAVLGLDAAPLWVAGSTHPGEEAPVLAAYERLRGTVPGLRLLIAPRHIERAEEVALLVQARMPALRRTQIKEGTPPEAGAPVLVLDTVGELAHIYAAADVAFVGGSLIERGGHNLLEPVLCGVPVVFGPHVANFREAASLVQSAGVGQMVRDAGELEAAVRHWLTDEQAQSTVSDRAQAALEEHRGAAMRVAQIVAQTLNNRSAPDAAAPDAAAQATRS